MNRFLDLPNDAVVDLLQVGGIGHVQTNKGWFHTTYHFWIYTKIGVCFMVSSADLKHRHLHDYRRVVIERWKKVHFPNG